MMSSPLLPAWALAKREVVRFFRQRNRVIGAVGQPVLFWLLFGAGLQRSFRLSDAPGGGQDFLEWYFPGTLILILLFTAIFATISIIEDRREGFLQSVLVAPAPRWTMVLGKVTGGAAIAVFQGMIFLGLAWAFQLPIAGESFLALVALLTLTALALTSLGFVLAWRMESTQGFHAIMNLLLMPMWLLSGAFFPPPAVGSDAATSQWIMHALMRLNPLTYAVGGVRRTLYSGRGADLGLDPTLFWTPSPAACWTVTIAFAIVAFAAAWWMAGRRTAGDLLS
jgi:ABC-2 type transport system permease protein